MFNKKKIKNLQDKVTLLEDQIKRIKACTKIPLPRFHVTQKIRFKEHWNIGVFPGEVFYILNHKFNQEDFEWEYVVIKDLDHLTQCIKLKESYILSNIYIK